MTKVTERQPTQRRSRLLRSKARLRRVGDAKLLAENQSRDGAAIQYLNQAIRQANQRVRASREIAETKSRAENPERLAAFRCQACDAIVLADRVFDVSRKMELAMMANGIVTQPTPADELLAESFEAPRKWIRCLECASSDVCFIQDESEVEAGSIETAMDAAHMAIDELNRELPHFADDPVTRVNCGEILWSLCATLSRAGELAREEVN